MPLRDPADWFFNLLMDDAPPSGSSHVSTNDWSPMYRITLTILFSCFFVFTLLTGCNDNFAGFDDPPKDRKQTTTPVTAGKLRHPDLMSRARQPRGAGKFGNQYALRLVFSIDKQSVLERYGTLDRYAVLERYTTLDRYAVVERYDYENVFAGFAITIDDSLGLSDYNAFLDQLELDPDILWYEPDYSVTLPTATGITGSTGQQVPWSVAAIGGMSSWTRSGDGHGSVGVDVYILDTGVAHASTNDPDDDLNLVENIDFRDSTQTPTPDASDHDGHGTHIAGIIGAVDDADGLVGVAPGTRIHNYKVLDDNGTTDVSVVIAAVEAITTHKLANPATPMVVNMSIGENVGTPAYTALDEAIDVSIDAGVVYVVAAGNQGDDAFNVTPAKVPGAITVGSYDVNGVFSPFSNWGPAVDILAPGEAIISLGIGNQGPQSMAGTSMATAHVTGAAALYLAQHPTATPAQVQAALLADSKSFVVGEPTGTTNHSVWVGETQVVEARVADGNDDAEEFIQDGGMYLTSSDLELAYEGIKPQIIGMRFAGLDVPRGATVTRAYVQFTVDEADTGAATLAITGQADDNAAPFTSSNHNLSSRPTTTASVPWVPAPWPHVGAAGPDQQTPDLKAVIQEIVNRNGWAAGHALALIVSGTGERTAESYNGSPSQAPLLHIEWQ